MTRSEEPETLKKTGEKLRVSAQQEVSWGDDGEQDATRCNKHPPCGAAAAAFVTLITCVAVAGFDGE